MKKYTAVIFCHGIGSPRHYLTTADFIDALDAQGNLEKKSELGYLRKFESKIELLDQENLSTRNYVSFTRFQEIKGKGRPVKKYRVYEAYWADDHHDNSTMLHAIYWLLKVIISFVRSSTSSWRSYPSLKKRVLSQLDIKSGSLETIEALYDAFENTDVRQEYPKGDFGEFQRYIKDQRQGQVADDLSKLAVTWRSEVQKDIKRRIIKSLVVSAPIFSTVAFIFVAAFFVGTYLPTKPEYLSWTSMSMATLIACVSTFLLLWLGWVLARRLVSDVIAWTTTHESQKNFLVRDRRIKISQDIIKDVLNDKNCLRCVLIGHSLGSSIILEAFLRQNSICRATNLKDSDREKMASNIKKVSHIITVGSPIEKIASLFYSDSAQHHRYHKIKHTNPNRLSSPAWSSSGSPHIINFWSRYDHVSSEIHSLTTFPGIKWNGVENIETAPCGVPVPFLAHSGYFKDPNVMKVIYQAIASGKIEKSRILNAKFDSQITKGKKGFLVFLFVLAVVFDFVWFIQGSPANWLQFIVLVLNLGSVVATVAVVQKDYTRHRRSK